MKTIAIVSVVAGIAGAFLNYVTGDFIAALWALATAIWAGNVFGLCQIYP